MKSSRLRPCVYCLLVMFAIGSLPPAGLAAEDSARLKWDRDTGAVLETSAADVWLDRNEHFSAPDLQFLPQGERQTLTNPTVVSRSAGKLKLSYRVTAPEGATIDVVREIALVRSGQGIAAVETFTLKPSKPLAMDVEIRRPFTLVPKKAAESSHVVCPLKHGWAKTVALDQQAVRAEYRLGYALADKETSHLALPVVQLGGPTAAVMADPMFSSQFEINRNGDRIEGTVRYRYAGSRVPLQEETRQFGFWISPAEEKPFPAAVDAFFELMLPDVPPGPRWLHEIAMVDYDYLSDGGKGWERDLKVLAEWIRPEDRHCVVLCLHGWYDAIGSYSYDAKTGRMKDKWVGFGPTQKIPLTPEEMKRRMRAARKLGFRVLLYFADGLASDSGAVGYRDDWIYRDTAGKPIPGWQGPDTFGPTYWLNPAHPEVSAWFLDYMDALLQTFGKEVDGFVWDETYQAKIGQIAEKPQPAYCDRAMMRLTKDLAARVHAFDPQKAFLVSDCTGGWGLTGIPGYAMVAHGTYQDTGCQPQAWPWGLFSNWRNVLWSCNWTPISGFHNTRYGVQQFGTPVAISNGYGDDRGPSEYTPDERDQLLELFAERLKQTERVRYLTEDPHRALQGDPLPQPEEDTVNWALAAQGSRATASSEDAPGWPAAGTIDGVRDATGWGSGHGWASGEDPRPHWLQIDFPEPRTIDRFVVITYGHEQAGYLTLVWGVTDYEIQIWDTSTSQWKTAVTEAEGRTVQVRVHNLPKPVRTDKFRIVVNRVAPPDGRARLLQLEAWGESD